MSEAYLVIDSVCKKLKGREVLKDVSFEVPAGKIVGVAGPNGSGKTMLMRAIAGLIRLDSGEIRVGGAVVGRDVASPPSVGLLLEGPAFLGRFSGLENLRLLASVAGTPAESELEGWIERVGLDPKDRRSYSKYSLGMRQRLGLAAALMGEPKLLLLDEPTNALDSEGQELARNLIRQARDGGAAVLLACHDAATMAELADEVWFMAEGHVDGHETFGAAEPQGEYPLVVQKAQRASNVSLETTRGYSPCGSAFGGGEDALA